MRNTPTGVGKTQGQFPLKYPLWKHPHGCGEDMQLTHTTTVSPETPPRVWGRRLKEQGEEYLRGNTPTGVGKTPDPRKS